MTHIRAIPATLILAVWIAVAAPLYAQMLKSTILGTITDGTGAVVPGAQVSITETGTNTHRSTLTNESGFYAVANLDPGVYRLEVEQAGFRRVTRANIDLPPNNTVRLDLELQPGVVTEVVDVTATAPILKTDRADTGGQLEVAQLQVLPLGTNRNYQGLLMTIPGTGGKAIREHSEFYNSQDNLSNRVNGQERAANNFMIEGVDNNIETGSLTAIIPPIEALQTVDVNTSSYDSEFGRAGAAVVNAVLKSGTNDFHGGLFHFHKNENLFARDVFATTKAPTVYNQFGGTLGGRIRRDKTFFFLDYQGSRDHKGAVEIPTIPTMAFRSGDLSSSSTAIYDPLAGDSEGRNRTPFPNNQIPANRISPIARRLLALLPAPTRAATLTNFERSVVRVKQLDAADIKIDHVLTGNDRIMGRYSIQQANVADPGLYGPNNGIYGGPHAGGFQGYGPARTQSLGLNYSKIFSPTLVMEARGGVLRNRNDAFNWDFGTNASDQIGIPGVNLDQWSSGLTEIRINGGYNNPVLGFEQSLPWYRSTTNFSFTINWTKTLHNHVLKWGYDLRRYRIDLQQTDPPRGRFVFGDGPTVLNGSRSTSIGNNFASFLLDQPTQIVRGLAPVFPARRDWVHSLYFQDKWQVSPRLTADLGLRWEYWPSSKPRFPGGFSNYNWTKNTIELAGIGNIPMDLGVESQPKSFAPRLGLAYRINARTVIRAGFGMSYNSRFIANYGFPVRQQNTFNPPNTYTAAGSMAAGIPPPDFVVIPASGIIDPAPPTASVSVTKKDLPHSYVESWNIAVQRSLPGNFALEVTYVGNHVLNQQTGWNLNAASRLGGGTASQPFFALYGRSAAVNVDIGTHQYYDAMQVKFDRRFSNGFMLTTAYTYSKSINFSPRQYFDLSLDKGRTNFDLTHVFTQAYVYDLPFGPGKRWVRSGFLRWAVGDWQVNGLLLLETGRPLNFTYSSTSLNAPGHNNQPNLVGSGTPEVLGRVGVGQLWFDTSRFAAPAPLTFGNVGRNILSGPGVVNLDLSVFRRFKLTERFNMEFRAESFNFSNTPHFANPGTTFGSATFGQVTASEDFISSATDTDNRKIQFGLKLFF